MNEEIQRIDGGAVLTVADLKSRIERIQHVTRTLMKKDVHYGTIPGTPKPTLYSPGADLIAATFRIALNPVVVSERIDDDEAEFRVRVDAVAADGQPLGSGEGYASTREKKFRWRRPVHPKEYDAADPARRQIAFDSKGSEQQQVRQSPGDVANTVLQMAVKRAKVSCVRRVAACSDVFAQDIEDLPEGAVAEPEQPKRASASAPAQAEPEKPADPSAPPSVKVVAAKILKKGTKQNGEPYTLHLVATSDGIEGTTFSTSMYALAAECMKSRAPVVAVWSEVDAEGRRNLEQLQKV